MRRNSDFPIGIYKDDKGIRIDEEDFWFWFKCGKLLDEIKQERMIVGVKQ